MDTLPFLSLEVPCDSLGSLLLNFVFHFSVFLNPGLGVYRQAPGRSMGTNAAPPWAQPMLRAYERASPLPSPWALFRFIDDGFLLFLAEDAAALKQYLVRMYPADLPFSFDHDCVRANVPFLDVLYIVVSLWPLRISIFWKPTHTCTYIAWDAYVLRHIRMQWVRGEFIRYLRICFDELFYNMCCRRLQRALIFLRYPLWVLERQRVSWADRPNYLVRCRDLVVAVGGFFQSKILLERTTMILIPCHKLSGTVLCPR